MAVVAMKKDVPSREAGHEKVQTGNLMTAQQAVGNAAPVKSGRPAATRNVTVFHTLVTRLLNRSADQGGIGVFYGWSGLGKSKSASFASQTTQAAWVEIGQFTTSRKLMQHVLMELRVKPLPPIVFDRSDCVSWSVTPYGRPAYGKVSSAWVDQKTGKRHVEEHETGLDGPELLLPEAQPDKERAKREAKAEGKRLTSDTSSGRFVMYGRPTAQAGAPVEPSGFRRECLGPWIAHAVEHEVTEAGFLTTVSIKSPPEPKKAGVASGQNQSSGGSGAASQGSSLWWPTDGSWPSDGAR